MGPAEISVPSAVENVIRDRYYYDVYMNDVHFRKITLPPGHHKRVNSLIEVMHFEQYAQMPLDNADPLLVEFSVNSGRISVKFSEVFTLTSPSSSVRIWPACWISTKT